MIFYFLHILIDRCLVQSALSIPFAKYTYLILYYDLSFCFLTYFVFRLSIVLIICFVFGFFSPVLWFLCLSVTVLSHVICYSYYRCLWWWCTSCQKGSPLSADGSEHKTVLLSCRSVLRSGTSVRVLLRWWVWWPLPSGTFSRCACCFWMLSCPITLFWWMHTWAATRTSLFTSTRSEHAHMS